MRYTHFSKTERLELSVLLKKGYSLREIGMALKKSPSSVSREVKRCGGRKSYNPHHANQYAQTKRKDSKYQGMKVREYPELQGYIKEKLPLSWSPDRIAGRWNREHPDEAKVSAHAIYKWLYSIYGNQYCKYLRSKQYRRRKHTYRHEPRTLIKNRVSIEQRPKEITERKEFGHFEADTMGRPRTASPQTLDVARERMSRFLIGKKVARLAYAMDGFKELFDDAPAQSITWDNGVENVRYEELKIPSYFCNPYSSWEKGSVENGIGIVRHFIPKGSDLKNYSHARIREIFDTINAIPMKCLQYQTPAEVYQANLLSTQCCT